MKLEEAVSVIIQANKLATKHTVADSQIISVLLLDNQDKIDRLLQVSTGEGKSTIISVFTIIKALQGHKVDIITSSPVLAEPDSRETSQLYKMFNLSCSDNADKSPYIKGSKGCYKKDIVYG